MNLRTQSTPFRYSTSITFKPCRSTSSWHRLYLHWDESSPASFSGWGWQGTLGASKASSYISPSWLHREGSSASKSSKSKRPSEHLLFVLLFILSFPGVYKGSPELIIAFRIYIPITIFLPGCSEKKEVHSNLTNLTSFATLTFLSFLSFPSP